MARGMHDRARLLWGRIRARSSLRIQRFACRYEVVLRNTSPKQIRALLFVPLPSDSATQRIESDFLFAPTRPNHGVDPVFDNRYVTWTVIAEPGKQSTYTIGADISVKPTRIEPAKRFNVSDYNRTAADYVQYTAANAYLHPDDAKIQSLVSGLQIDADDVLSRIAEANRCVISSLSYGSPIDGLYSDLDALEKDHVDCGGFDSLFVSLCIAQGIPARIVSGFWAVPSGDNMHAWAEALLPDNTWIPVDPSVEALRNQGRSQKLASVGCIGSDRVAFSYGCDIQLEAEHERISASILQHPIVYPASVLGGLTIQSAFTARVR